ncbi:hypothetical protein WA026_015106 [Henosepilachna vigintioctopunctata]|uniref:Uncharacterized protein n=1 Tax=Henosepilachna vigintioctopunctata TaxID=420089 RepID=A0AAW1TTB7_9CUCU
MNKYAGSMHTLYNTELNKLENTQKQLERYQHNLLGQLKKNENEEFQDLIQLFQGSRVACNEAASKLELQEILDKLKYVKKAVVLECGSNIPDLKLFEQDLTHIISTVQDMKVKSKLKVQELTSEENLLIEDIKLYEERVSHWSEPVKLDSIKNGVHAKIDSSNTVPDDVKKFMDFVKCSNGHENGWSVSDNQLFLKLRKKCKDVDEVAVSLNKILPDITIEDVKIHEDWYLKYLELKEKHNIAIENWKKSKHERNSTDSKRVNECVKSEGLKKIWLIYKCLKKKILKKRKLRKKLRNGRKNVK